ncbi:MAG: GNAT family N-acetyltransferase [Cyanobacteria bacterium CRU_2_1]|nr:GNAT family N-acetyltransferase [Cyanobacteria bacterium CRU_2_1]
MKELRYSLAQAAQRYGKKRIALHATPAGFPMYQRMGYQPTADLRTYPNLSATRMSKIST